MNTKCKNVAGLYVILSVLRAGWERSVLGWRAVEKDIEPACAHPVALYIQQREMLRSAKFHLLLLQSVRIRHRKSLGSSLPTW